MLELARELAVVGEQHRPVESPSSRPTEYQRCSPRSENGMKSSTVRRPAPPRVEVMTPLGLFSSR